MRPHCLIEDGSSSCVSISWSINAIVVKLLHLMKWFCLIGSFSVSLKALTMRILLFPVFRWFEKVITERWKSPAVCSWSPCSARLLNLPFWYHVLVSRILGFVSWPFLRQHRGLDSPGLLHLFCLAEFETTALRSVRRGQRCSKWGLSAPEELPAESPTTSRIIDFTMCRLHAGTQALNPCLLLLWFSKKLSAQMDQNS